MKCYEKNEICHKNIFAGFFLGKKNIFNRLYHPVITGCCFCVSGSGLAQTVGRWLVHLQFT